MSNINPIAATNPSDAPSDLSQAHGNRSTSWLRVPSLRDIAVILALTTIGLLAITFRKEFTGPLGLVVNLVAVMAPTLPAAAGIALRRRRKAELGGRRTSPRSPGGGHQRRRTP